MKIFASALLAASSTALSIHPDFFAGFIYGMTDSNNLVEMKACFDDSHLVAEEAHKMINDLADGDIARAALMFKKLKSELPVALGACHTMDDDKPTLDDWLNEFKEPEHVIKEATFHYARNKDQVHTDRQSEKDHWAAE